MARSQGKTPPRKVSPHSFSLVRLSATLPPFRVHWFPTLRSTNDHAAAMRTRGELFAPAVVLTGRQTAGRGRGAHAWWSQAGVLTVTFVFPIESHLAPHQVPLIAGLAVRAAAAELTEGAPIKLKWPNDLLFEGRKLAGLLCERVQKADLIGLGLNVNLAATDVPRSLRGATTSLSEIAGQSFDLTDTLATVARQLHRLLSRRGEQPFGQLLREYDEHHALIGQRVSILSGDDKPAIVGRCEGLDSMGRLCLRQKGSVYHIIAGHVQLL